MDSRNASEVSRKFIHTKDWVLFSNSQIVEGEEFRGRICIPIIVILIVILIMISLPLSHHTHLSERSTFNPPTLNRKHS